MRPTTHVETFLAAPVGAYVTGASFLVWVESRERIGMFHIGSFDRADQPALERIFRLVKHPALSERYDLLHDISEVSAFDEAAFQFFVGFLQQWVHELVPRVRRLAVVRPQGVAGAAFSGLFHEWVVPRFDAKLCATRDEAYAFLAVPATARETLDVIAATAGGEPALRRLRAVLEENLAHASIASAATAMSTSTRSLQRMLAGSGTTFRRELLAARMRVAQTWLLARDDKVETIARELGFASAAAFSTTFRKVVGETPSAFRERFLAR